MRTMSALPVNTSPKHLAQSWGPPSCVGGVQPCSSISHMPFLQYHCQWDVTGLAFWAPASPGDHQGHSSCSSALNLAILSHVLPSDFCIARGQKWPRACHLYSTSEQELSSGASRAGPALPGGQGCLTWMFSIWCLAHRVGAWSTVFDFVKSFLQVGQCFCLL